MPNKNALSAQVNFSPFLTEPNRPATHNQGKPMKQMTLILLALLLTAPAFAGKSAGKEEHHKGHKGKAGMMFKQLDLSKEQKAQVKEIRKSRKEKMKSLHSKKKEARKEFKTAMKANASKSKLRNLHNKILDASKSLKKYKFRTMLKTRDVLTDSQRVKFSKLYAESHKKHGK